VGFQSLKDWFSPSFVNQTRHSLSFGERIRLVHTMKPAAIRTKPVEELSLLPASSLTYRGGQANTIGEEASNPINSRHSSEGSHFSSKSEVQDGAEQPEWRTGFWLRFPVWGIMALAATVVSTIAAVFITIKCDNQSISSWTLSPTVLLSILSSLSNILLSFALGEGLVISFWQNSSQGSTVSQEIIYHT
jgi:hypothetical protein